MNDLKRYVPVLRFKQSERNALAELFKWGIDTKGMTPLFELVPKPFIPRDASVSNILDDIADKVLGSYGKLGEMLNA